MKHPISAIALISISSVAFAQDNDIQMLPTTVVTGELWESDIQNTTASVTVIDQAVLENNGVQHFEDVINAIPNLTWTGGSSRPRFIQIRGIGENSQFEGETPDSAIRFLIDDLDLTGLGTVGNLFDANQVEVLRGSQAGAFGANAAGGVIKIVTNDPTPYWTGQVESTFGSDSLIAGGLAVGGPILENDPETLSFRLAIHQLNQDGFRDNSYLDKNDTNERDEFTSRFKLRWLANDDWQWDATLLYADADNGYDEWSLHNTEFDIQSDDPGRDEQETFASAIRGSWTGLEHATLTTVSNYSTTDSLYSYDNDWTSGDYDTVPAGTYDGFISNQREHETFSQELRLDSIEQSNALGWIDRWTLGTYFQHLEEDTETNYADYGGTADAEYIYVTDSYSIFGQFAHDFSIETRLVIGLRYEYHAVDMETEKAEDSGPWYDNSLSDEDSHESSSLWGGKITLEHDLNQKQMLFTSISRGYKAAGANNGIFRAGNDPLTYEDETLYNFEFGLRSEWFDRQVVSQVTSFYLYRDNPQLRDSAGSGGFFRYFTSNGDKAQHYGLEAEATWFMSEEWTLSAGLGLLETQDDTNDELANAPSYTFNAQLNYRAENGVFANLSVQGSDEYFESNNKENRSERTRSSFVTFNGSIGYKYQNWTFTVWGTNLFDEEYEKRVFFFDNYDGQGDTRFENPANPRAFGVTANYSW